MKIIDSVSGFDGIEKGCALTIGNFDGVHLGHADIIEAGLDAARRKGLGGLAAMTFDPHPMAVLHPERALGILTPMPVKLRLLESCGVDCLIILKNSIDLLNLSPKDFVDEFLMKAVGPGVVIEGPNFNFGYGRSGDVGTLRELGLERGFEVVVVEPRVIEVEGNRVMCSSSVIRSQLRHGNVGAAAGALGRFYRLIGETVPGRGIGRRLGFATANIDPVDQVIPAEGVYAGFVTTGESADDVSGDGQRRQAAFSIGRAKTFLTDHPLLVEAHILEDDVEDLRGKWLGLDFVKRIRGQKRFETHQQLQEQISSDCEHAAEILGGL